MTFDPNIDRLNMRLAKPTRRMLLADGRRIAIVGARGWIGRTTLALLREALGADGFASRVVCFGSADGAVELDDGIVVSLRALAQLGELHPWPTLLFHLAFLTKDRVSGMDAAIYEAANRELSRKVYEALDRIGVDRLFVASSGAAAFADDPQAATDLQLYGRLKREDENLFDNWAAADPFKRRVAIGRIFSVSGPFINKLQTYALASFINDALAGRPISVTAVQQVFRSYVAVRDVVSLALSHLLFGDAGETPALLFETGGEAVELGDLAARIAGLLGSEVVRPPMREGAPSIYCGDDAAWRGVQQRYSLCGASLDEQIAETAAYLSRELRGA